MAPININIITPCFNEEDNIKPFYYELVKYVKKYNYKITSVDDGSTDDTFLKIKEISAVDNHVQYIRLSRNFGHQSAIKAGIDNVNVCDVVVIMGVDLQHPPAYIDEMICKWGKG